MVTVMEQGQALTPPADLAIGQFILCERVSFPFHLRPKQHDRCAYKALRLDKDLDLRPEWGLG
jgi:hypothetical protein